MHLTLLETQLLASTILVLPTIVILLFAFLRGDFRKAEDAGTVVLLAQDEDWWEQEEAVKDGR